jgi:hypothetical protein
MSDIAKPLKTQKFCGDCAGYIFCILDWTYRIVFASQYQRWASDSSEVLQEIKSPSFATQKGVIDQVSPPAKDSDPNGDSRAVLNRFEPLTLPLIVSP